MVEVLGNFRVDYGTGYSLILAITMFVVKRMLISLSWARLGEDTLIMARVSASSN